MAELTWRDICHRDLPEALAIEPKSRGEELVGRETANRCWEALLREPSFRGIVIEAQPAIEGHRIVATGMGAFVEADFMTAEIEHPRVDLNSRIIASIASGRSVLLQKEKFGRCNAGSGMDIVNLQGAWLRAGLNSGQVSEINTLLAQSFFESFRGYRFHRILREAVNQAEIDLMEQAAGFRTVAAFPECQRALKLITRDDALAAPHSMAGVIFRFRNPELQLREAEQGLLLAALKGSTDEELSEELALSLPAIKKRWLAIFARIEQLRPDFFGGEESENVRGRQKRHRVISYVRTHPEELRPFERPKRLPA